MKKTMHLKSLLSCLIVFAVIVCGVYCTGLLDMSKLKIDATEEGILSISEESTVLMKAARQDVTLYFVSDGATGDIWAREIARRVADANSRIRFKQISLAEGAAISGNPAITEGSVIVSGLRMRTLLNAELYLQTAAYNPQTGAATVTSYRINAERKIAEAVEYATRADIRKVYSAAKSLPPMTVNALTESGREVAPLDIAEGAPIPEDADAVVLYAPDADITQGAKGALADYIARGGKIFLFTNYTKGEWAALDGLTAQYGMEAVHGVVLESDPQRLFYAGYPQCVLAESVDTTLTGGESATLAFPTAHAIKKSDAIREGVALKTLFTTSDAAYMKGDASAVSTLAKEENDIAGAFDLAMMAVEKDGALVWFASSDMLLDEINSYYVSNADIIYVTKAITALCGEVAPSALSDAPDSSRNLMATPLEFEGAGKTVITVILFALPLCVFAICMIALPRRRKRRA